MGTQEAAIVRKTCMWETTAHANVRGDFTTLFTDYKI
jgi:hypothetical protein